MKKVKLKELYTKEGKMPSEPLWNVYPRPQLKRDSFLSLNGEWELTAPNYEGKIRVPFAPESILSGVNKCFPDGSELIYRKTFTLPDEYIQQRIILHIGAADQYAYVFVNGEPVGEHAGGYESFSFDITNYIEAGENLVEIRIWDELDKHVMPYGKQKHKRGGMWYTPVSGIWQTVWIESVPEEYVKSLRIVTGADCAEIYAEGVENGTVTASTPDGEISASLVDGYAKITVEEPVLWSPENPYLYKFTLTSGKDKVDSYFALRTVEIKDIDGISRICLNGKPYFFHGLLDQGYWSDGLFTPAVPELYEYDIATMKSLGFNMLRKHIKIEPEQFYYDCDRLGMIVFQDMINNGDYSFFRDTALPTVGMKKLDDRKLHKNKETRAAFVSGMESTVKQLSNHPCIVLWTIFNEGWGQFDSSAMYEKLKELDPTRIIDSASGWFEGGNSDVVSEHLYFKKYTPHKTNKPLILSEFGGYSCKIPDHSFNISDTYGYRFFTDVDEFEESLYKLYEDEVIPAVKQGLCASVYTQVSDVEDETNGLLTYDRAILKVSPERMRAVSAKLISEIES